MSSALFRQIASGGQARRSERLLRAAVSAFASLTRPTRREIAQLDDLALPLLPSVPVETRRYAAAILCECASAPPRLVRRLCEESVDVAAPLLMRSPVLSNVDLIDLIARHGLGHARVIGRRADLEPAIAALVRALIAQSESGAMETAREGAAADDVRARLRAMMRQSPAPAGSSAPPDPAVDDRPPYKELRQLALAGESERFATALAARLDMPPARARAIAYGDLMTALRALDMSAEQAFLLTACRFPGRFSSTTEIRIFIERYRASGRDAARERVRLWRAGAATARPAPQAAAMSK